LKKANALLMRLIVDQNWNVNLRDVDLAHDAFCKSSKDHSYVFNGEQSFFVSVNEVDMTNI